MRRLSLLVLALTLLLWGLAVPAAADPARENYFAAEACQRKLLKSRSRQKYRDNWLTCIQKFQQVYRTNPNGSWAAAGLYRTGELYAGLYRQSGKKADRTEALDIFQRIVKRYPNSSYRPRAVDAMRRMVGAAAEKPPAVSAPRPAVKGKKAREEKARQRYLAAEACHRKLRNDPRRRKYRENWFRCIDAFQEVQRHDPAGPWAAAGLFMTAGLYEEMYGISYKADDRQNARRNYQRILREYPDSRYRDRARRALAAMTVAKSVSGRAKSPPAARRPPPAETPDAVGRVIARGAKPAAERPPVKKANGPATITALRHWSNPNYTRIVIDADREAAFRHRLLKKDPRIGKPQRLYIDLDDCRLANEIRRTFPINDDLLSDARAGQNTPDAVRVVVDIKSAKTYKIFSLKNPFRVVVDVWGTGKKKSTAARKPPTPLPPSGKIPAGALARQLALGVRRIVIDPGHGGKDYGAPGYLKGVHEKKVALELARQLSRAIRKRLDCDVVLTRDGDRFLSLEERTAIANTRDADLFISIHTNAARDRRAYGIETYFLNLATDEAAIRVAARENATSTKNISDLESILTDLMQNAKINESSRLARHVQDSVTGHLRTKYNRIKNKGVKQAPFYVLLGAQMPAILIETSFISNPRECKRLVSKAYRERLCDGIVKGIEAYIKATNPQALRRPRAKTGTRG